MIKSVQMFEGQFKGARTAYSANSIFIGILSSDEKYDAEAIGEIIFPAGFGVVEPPGPSFGFGPLVLTDKEASGRILLKDLKGRKDSDGKEITDDQIKEALEEYMDAFFEVDTKAKTLVQITFDEFYRSAQSDNDYEVLHICEFEPEEDFDDED